MDFKSIIYSTENSVAWLEINRPEQKNKVNAQLAAEIADACRLIDEDDNIKVLVISGTGETFCGGAENNNITPVSALLADLTKPVIAVINGDAIGQGLEITLAADIRIASDKACFSMPQVSEGYLPFDGGSQRLPRIVGKAKAMELLLTGQIIDAAEARRIGLVSRLYPQTDLAASVNELALKMSQYAPISLCFTREAVYQGLDMTLEQGLRLEADLYSILQTTADREEGIKAFLEKRRPGYQGK